MKALSVNLFGREIKLTIAKGVSEMKEKAVAEVQPETRIQKLARQYFEERSWRKEVVFREISLDQKTLSITLVDREVGVRAEMQLPANEWTLACGAQDVIRRNCCCVHTEVVDC